MTPFDYGTVGLLIAFVAATWLAPRRAGVVALLLVQVAVFIGYFVLAGVAITIGRYEYDGLLSIIGLSLQAFVLNCLLLPIGLVALWRRQNAHRTEAAQRELELLRP